MQLKKFFHYLENSFYDKNFTHNKLQYMWQCLLTTAVLLAILMSLNVLPNAVVIASIGASAFVVFAMPHKESSRARYVIGSYIVGIVIGSLCYYFLYLMQGSQVGFLNHYCDEIFGAVSVGLTTFCMVIFDVEHPPAAALALGLVLREWSVKVVLVTIVAVLLMLLFRKLLRNHLIDLI